MTKPKPHQSIRSGLGALRTCPVCGRRQTPTVGGKLAAHWPPGTVILCRGQEPPPCAGAGRTGAVPVAQEMYYSDEYVEAV